MQISHTQTLDQGRAQAARIRLGRQRSQESQVVWQHQLGFIAAHDTSSEQLTAVLRVLLLTVQIIPAESNGIDAINFRALRESKSVDFDRDSSAPGSDGAALDVIHGKAGSPSVVAPGTPGMLTPKELQGGLTPEMRAAGKTAYETEVNPFEEFRGVTRDIGDF